MEREPLSRLLDEGLSLQQIGDRLGKDSDTVGYWVRKHGLEPVHSEKHRPRGGIERGALEELITRGLSMRSIADELGVSLCTVRHWIRKYGLTATAYIRRSDGRRVKPAHIERVCASHGRTTFVLRRTGYRCKRCEADRVAARRRKVKRILIADAGGACALCGYDRCAAALQFHHVDPATKSFNLSRRGVTIALSKARDEARKCILLCANCHAEVEAGVSTIAKRRTPAGSLAPAPRGGFEPP